MELQLFKASQEFDKMKRVVSTVFEAVPRLVINYRRTLDVLETYYTKCLDQEKTIRQLEREKADLIKEKEATNDSLRQARKQLDDEKLKTGQARKEADTYREKLWELKNVLNDNSMSFQGDTLSRLKTVVPDDIFVDDAGDYNRLDTIAEIETTGSILTDLSYTRDEDDIMLDDSPKGNKRSHQEKENEKPSKRRKSTTFKAIEVTTGERLIATTTVTVEPNGPCTATSTIENCSTPLGVKTGSRCPRNQYTSDSKFITGSANGYYDPPKALSSTSSLNSQLSPTTLRDVNNRRHLFSEKSILTGDTCDVCGKRFKFAVTGLKCKDCKSVVHQQCQEKLPLPCIAIAGTPSKNSKTGGIADYTPSTPPMVPALLIHCIKEIERRGLREIGLYRVPGSDKEVRTLKEKLLRGRKVPNLSDIRDINIICGTVKAFLVDLKEPITTSIRWNEFVSAAKCLNEQEKIDRLTEIIGGLPQPNRHTLSYLLLHLQKVASSPETLMKFDSLAKVFGPSLFGVPSKGANHSEAVDECNFANEVVFEMLKLPGEVYETFLSEFDGPGQGEAFGLPKTPSANSLKYFMSSPITVKKNKTSPIAGVSRAFRRKELTRASGHRRQRGASEERLVRSKEEDQACPSVVLWADSENVVSGVYRLKESDCDSALALQRVGASEDGASGVGRTNCGSSSSLFPPLVTNEAGFSGASRTNDETSGSASNAARSEEGKLDACSPLRWTLKKTKYFETP